MSASNINSSRNDSKTKDAEDQEPCQFIRLHELKKVFTSGIMKEIFSYILPKAFLKLDDNTTNIDIDAETCKEEHLNIALVGICLKFRKLENLSVALDYESKTILDFGRLYLPHLKSLDLSQINLSSFNLSNRNVPNLDCLSLENMTDDINKFNVMGLKKLTNLSINHVFINDSKGFEKFVWSSPNLESFTSYKCRGLDKQIWYLPNIEEIDLHRAECLESLILLYVPKLTHLSVRAAYSCETIRIYNCPQITIDIFKTHMVCVCC